MTRRAEPPTTSAEPSQATSAEPSRTTSAEPSRTTSAGTIAPGSRNERSFRGHSGATARAGSGSSTARRAGSGFVSLVGAGPGDPELLTLRACRRLAEADLVLYDALAGAELLELAPNARRFFVGKRAGRHSIDQAGIHALMIRAAQRGDRVVRLKCGDPFVLGRGGEEALALAAAGVPYEVVPGVSSAIAAPALAGIPVTHRGIAAGFAVISGHAEEAFGPPLDSLAPGALTIVVLMGLRTRAALAARLIARGWPATTPAAIVLGASHAGATRWLGTLGELSGARFDSDQAGAIVIGDVVALAAQIGRDLDQLAARRIS